MWLFRLPVFISNGVWLHVHRSLTRVAEERWPGSNGLRTGDNFVVSFHYRRPSEKTENGQSIPIAQDWIGAENNDGHHVTRAAVFVGGM